MVNDEAHTPPEPLTGPDQPCPQASPSVTAGDACCVATVAHVRATGGVQRCPGCGAELYLVSAAPPPAAPVLARPGLDLREGEVPEPTGRFERTPRAPSESPEVIAVRRLLCELRPGGAPPDGDPTADPPPKPSPPMRDQGGMGGHGGVPRGAFGRVLGADELDVPARIARVSATNPRAALALSHLRQLGTLRHGYGALCVGVAHAVAERDRRVAWDDDAARAWDRARMWGAVRVTEAIAAWEGAA